MPPISGAHLTMVFKAVLALLVIGGTVITGLTVVGCSYDSIFGTTEMHLPPPQNPLAVRFSPNLGLESCPTCLFSQSDDIVRDHHDSQQSPDDKPTPTRHLKISYAAPIVSSPSKTPPPITPIAKTPTASTSITPEPSSFLMPITPLPGTSRLMLFVIWCQNLFRYFARFVYTLSIAASRPKDQHGWRTFWVITCGVIGSTSLTAMVFLLVRRPTLSPKFLELPAKTKRSLNKVTAILSGGFYSPKTLKSGIVTFLEDCFRNEERLVRVTNLLVKDTLAKKKAKIVHDANMRIKATLAKGKTKINRNAKREVERLRKVHADTLAKENAKINRNAKREVERLRKVHAEELDATYERDVFAAAKIRPSFGPSVENAELEFRGRVDKVKMKEGKREDIIDFFRNIVHSFSYAIAVGESRPEGSNTRYLSIIHEQDRLINSLRLLHQYRERAFVESEELVRCLCQTDTFGELEVPQHLKECSPWNKYSVKDGKFIVSPPDGPTALSMNVSVSSAPFHRRPITILDSDPHWQRFIDSVAREQAEQETRLASLPDEMDDTKDGRGLETRGSSDQEKIRTKESVAEKEMIESLNWFKGQLAAMKAGHGTTKSPDPSDSAFITEVNGDLAISRHIQEMEWAGLSKEAAIKDCETQIEELEVDIACMRSANGI